MWAFYVNGVKTYASETSISVDVTHMNYLRIGSLFSSQCVNGYFAVGAPELGIPVFENRAWTDVKIAAKHPAWLSKLQGYSLDFPFD